MTEADVLSFQTEDWKPIPRIARIIPFGYEIDPDDDKVLLPVVLELEALKKAKIHLKQYSYRMVSQWLTKTTGRYISHMGLKKRLEIEQSRRRKASALRQWAKRIAEAQAKAAYLEERIGSSTKESA